MKHFFASLLLLGVWFGAQAQEKTTPPPADAPQQTARAELILDPDDDEVQVQSLPADTSVVLFIRHQEGARKVRYAFQRYGDKLRLRHEAVVEIPFEYELRRMCSEPGRVYALFGTLENRGKLLVVAYDVRGGQVRKQEFDTKLARQIVGLKALDGRLLVNVTLADEQHQTMLLLDVAAGRHQFMPTLYEPLSAGFTSVADRFSKRADFVLSQSNGRKQRLLLKRFSAEQGQLLSSQTVQTESERSLLTAQLSPLADTTARLLAGTYGLRDVHYAQGLFATDLTAPATDSRSALRFYDFRRLRHFFDYLKPAHEARLRDRAARREARQAAPIHWRYNLLLHEMLPQSDGGYLLVGEVYTPVYSYATTGYPGLSPLLNGYGGVGRTYGPSSYYTSSGRALLGFRTSHVLVCGFDKRGNLLWDNTYVVDSHVMRSELEEAVQPLTLPNGRVVLAYLDSEGELHYKRIDHSEPGDNDRQVSLLPFSTDGKAPDKILDTSQPDILPWTDSQYVASGFQHIRVPHGPERQVFFLQTLRF